MNHNEDMDLDEMYDEDEVYDEEEEDTDLSSEDSDMLALSTTGSLQGIIDDKFECLSCEKLCGEMIKLVVETNDIIGIKPTQLRILLNKFNWDKELLLEKFYLGDTEQESLFKEAHIVYKKEPPQNAVEEDTAECEICMADYTTKLMIGLDCGHKFCKSCWTNFLKGKIIDEGQSQTISCPSYECDILVDDELVMNLIQDKQVKERYQYLITDGFVQCSRTLRWCPTPDCHHVIKTSPGEKAVECSKCELVFCFKCGENWHAPINCEYLKKWQKKCADDSETSHWINANTKECPKCKVVIEKNGGCNHMVCRSTTCKYEFCWACLGAWDPHGPAWYTCNRYTAGDSKNAREEQEKSRAMLQRYLFYFDRFTNHAQSLQFENKLYDRIQAKMLEIQDVYQQSAYDVKFLKDAVDTLCKCRQALMYTYVFAFYLNANNHTEMFEHNQADLESSTEQLSSFLERDIYNSNFNTEVKIRVQDKKTYCDSRRQKLFEHVYEGEEAGLWDHCE